MHKNSKFRTSSLVTILVTSFVVSSLAGTSFVASANAAYTEIYGILDGAPFGVRFPDNWNGGLVLGCRGYSSTEPRANGTFFTGTAQAFLDVGYAFAASTYGSAGFCIQKGMNSTYQLTKYLISTYHVTGKVFLYGLSMGGAVALLLGEKYPNVYSGVIDGYGTKDLKEQYATKARWANLSDAALTAELTALTCPVPPSGYANLTAFRTFMATNVAEFERETGGTPTTKPKTYEDDSPTYHANISIPVITIQGTSDAIVPYYESQMYQTAVANAGRSNLYRFYTVVGAEHAASSINQQARFTRFPELVQWSGSLDWTLVTDARAVKAYPYLREYVWQKNATMPPNGQYDKIRLHRLVKTGITPKGVIFIEQGANSGEKMLSNPPSDNWTKEEKYSPGIYWANRGFDVYALDKREYFAQNLNASEMSSVMANWGFAQYISDYKEAINKAKEVSGATKVFFFGFGTGGRTVMNYASLYWREDLKGIILAASDYPSHDPVVAKRGNETNTYNLTRTVESMIANGTGATDFLGISKGRAQYALNNPGGPAEYPPGNPVTPAINPVTNKSWTNITEFATWALALRPGIENLTLILWNIATGFRYTPARLSLEYEAMAGWVNCPYLAYDYDDHWSEINVPLLSFTPGFWSNSSGTLRFINGIGSTDFTPVMLASYGPVDPIYGEYSARDVFAPAYDWMVSHLSSLDVSAFCNVIVQPGWTWWFFEQNAGGNGPYTYQWYEGLNPIQGQTSMVLPISKNTPGVYSFYCRVTDKDGTTTTSNAVTLTVLG